MSRQYAYYCVLRNYKGIFKKTFIGNTHLYIFPLSDDHYVYLGMIGELIDESQSYSCKLILEFENNILDTLIEGEKKEFKERFYIVESLACESIREEDEKIIICISKKGIWLPINIQIYSDERCSSLHHKLYIIHGDMKFNDGESLNSKNS